MANAETHAENPYLAHHFTTMEQQREAGTLGMWLFLAQEFMFFGGLFLAYAVNRFLHPEAWSIGSSSLSIPIGAANTVVLLLSSFTMAMGVYFAQTGKLKWLMRMLWATLLLGILFVVVKWFFEYSPKITEGVFPGFEMWGPHGHYGYLQEWVAGNETGDRAGLQLFFFMYFIMTGMHAFHMIIGFGLILWLMYLTKRGKIGPQRYMPIELFGLYWHFVDIVWVFLFPMFYLIPQH